MLLPGSLASNVGLQQTVTGLWYGAISDRTRTGYDTGYHTYLRFLALNNVHWISFPPISEAILILFVAHCFSVLCLQYSTIKSYLCGVRFAYISRGLQNPFTATDGGHLQSLQTILKSVQKHCQRPIKHRYPITSTVLKSMYDSLQGGLFTPYTDLLMQTVCSTAFFGFLRCGEFTCSSSFNPLVNLCIGDISFAEDHVILTLKASKTDPFRKGVSIRLFSTLSTVNPYSLLIRYYQIRISAGAVPTDPLFVTQTGSPLDRRTFITLLKSVLQHIGLDSDCYNGHSFRIGAASSCAAVRIEDHLIKTLGRWTSDCYYRYIRTPISAIRDAQRSLATGP
jgi:hypothetical protein